MRLQAEIDSWRNLLLESSATAARHGALTALKSQACQRRSFRGAFCLARALNL